MSYDNNYIKRSSAKILFTKAYSVDTLEELRTLIHKYYETEHPEVSLNTTEAHFDSLADAINDSQFHERKKKGLHVIKAKYLCEIFNRTNTSKQKSKEKMEGIKNFLAGWFQLHQKNNKEQLANIANGVLSDWKVLTNITTPQWTDYKLLPIEKGRLKSFTCDVITKSKYYRLGFKFLQAAGKLFGDGSIQSQDNNFIIHIGKNFIIKDLFITTYRNGIRENTDIYTEIVPKNNTFKCEFSIESEGLLHFCINDKEVYRGMINNEIRNRVYMLVWGDGNKYEANIRNIKIQTEGA